MPDQRNPARPPSVVWALVLLLCASCVLGETVARQSPSIAILVYHHVSEDTPSSTSVSPSSFEAHLDYLEEQRFDVVSLPQLVAALSNGGPLPRRAVAITFDDAYASVYTEALPRLEARRWPFTVFVATDYVDRSYGAYLTWDQLRDIERRGGRIGNHTAAHRHLVRREPGESDAAWHRRVVEDITRAQSRLARELSQPLKMLAWPYGEFDRDLEAVAAELGFVAFGQQSGPAGVDSGLQRLPRFPVAEAYAGLDSLAEKLRSRALPLRVLAPEDRVLEPGAGPPSLTIRLPSGPYRRRQLRCYVPGQESAEIEWHDDVARIRAREPLKSGRSKFNCTAPSIAEPGVYYWYSHLWIQPQADGSWYRE